MKKYIIYLCISLFLFLTAYLLYLWALEDVVPIPGYAYKNPEEYSIFLRPPKLANPTILFWKNIFLLTWIMLFLFSYLKILFRIKNLFILWLITIQGIGIYLFYTVFLIHVGCDEKIISSIYSLLEITFKTYIKVWSIWSCLSTWTLEANPIVYVLQIILILTVIIFIYKNWTKRHSVEINTGSSKPERNIDSRE